MALALKYAFFAFIAMAVNLGCQWISLALYIGLYSLYVAIFLGTLAGLIVKYALDKRYIFYYHVKNRVDNFGKFVLYSVMGVITTLIFWGFELSFNAFFPGRSAKFVGAIIGLTIGYLIKYRLDKRFVFIRPENGQPRAKEEGPPLTRDNRKDTAHKTGI